MSEESEKLQNLFNLLDDDFESRTSAERIKPPINYMGNKYGQLDFILPKIPFNEVWVDVFGGSGAVTLSKPRSKFEVFNDRFAGSVALFKCMQVKEKREAVIEKIQIMPHAREFFSWCKETWDKETDDVERAARWYYLIQASFAGRGEFFGRDIKGKNTVTPKIALGLDLFPKIAHRMNGVLIENMDYKQCLKDFDSPTTVFFLDPPYYGGDVYATGFTKSDHIEMCSRIFQCQGTVMLIGYENPIYDKFPWDEIHLNPDVSNKVVTMSFDKHNNMEGREGTVERGVRDEYLWIKV